MANPIIEQAQKLGQAISSSPQAARLRQVRGELDQQKDVLDLLKQYQEHFQKLQQMEEQRKPVEVADKRLLQELHDKLIANDLFKRYTSAQMEYVDLMRQVSDALHRELSGTEASPE